MAGEMRSRVIRLVTAAGRLFLLAAPMAFGLPVFALAQERNVPSNVPGATPSAPTPAPDSVVPVMPAPPVAGTVDLPRDLTPWGMYQAADPFVKAVLISLVIASVITWTVWLSKSIELSTARRRARKLLVSLASVRRLAAASRLTPPRVRVDQFAAA